jgi:hypothetical protein
MDLLFYGQTHLGAVVVPELIFPPAASQLGVMRSAVHPGPVGSDEDVGERTTPVLSTGVVLFYHGHIQVEVL